MLYGAIGGVLMVIAGAAASSWVPSLSQRRRLEDAAQDEAAYTEAANEETLTAYSDGIYRDWLYDGSTLSIVVHGCSVGPVDVNYAEDSGCLEQSSEDGTYAWYQMVNCQRAQVVFSVYADSNGGGTCSSDTFKESFVTKGGLSDFVTYIQNLDPYSPFGDNNDDDYYNDDAYDDEYDIDELPYCEGDENVYYGVGCTDEGKFSINYFEDQYCLASQGTYNELTSVNHQMSKYSDCTVLSAGGDDGDGDGEDGDEGGFAGMVPYLRRCSSLDSDWCSNDGYMKSRIATAYGWMAQRRHHNTMAGEWYNKSATKYIAGGCLLLFSFLFFVGLLVTNRQRRRRRMMTKRLLRARNRRRSKSRDGRSHRSKSRSRRSRSRAAPSSSSRSLARSTAHSTARSHSRRRQQEDQDREERRSSRRLQEQQEQQEREERRNRSRRQKERQSERGESPSGVYT